MRSNIPAGLGGVVGLLIGAQVLFAPAGATLSSALFFRVIACAVGFILGLIVAAGLRRWLPSLTKPGTGDAVLVGVILAESALAGIVNGQLKGVAGADPSWMDLKLLACGFVGMFVGVVLANIWPGPKA